MRGRLDWKYALGSELTDDGFDASVLSEFRSRLACEEAVSRMLALLLDRLAEKGPLAGGASAHGRDLCAGGDSQPQPAGAGDRDDARGAGGGHGLRAGLAGCPAPAPWYERYAQRASDYRLPRTGTTPDAHAMTVGQDDYLLLEAVHRAGAPPWLRQIPAVQVLRRVWVQRYYRQDEEVRWRGKGELPPSSLLIVSPYDTEARYGCRRRVNTERLCRESWGRMIICPGATTWAGGFRVAGGIAGTRSVGGAGRWRFPGPVRRGVGC